MKKIFIKAYIEKAGEKTYRFLASTSTVDRQGDSVDQSGWELKNFMKNPVILWAHRYDELPLGKAIELSITEKGLEAEIAFAEDEANPKAQQVKKLIDSGILSAVSVGFIPKERNGNIITRAELLEISIVPVPANQEALTLAFGNKEMDLSLIQKDIEDVLKNGDDIDTDEKAGRVISKENRKILEIAHESLKNSISEIEKLLALGVATTDEEDGEDKSKLIVLDREVVDELKSLLRSDNSNMSRALSLLKKL